MRKLLTTIGALAFCLALSFNPALAQDAAPADWGELAGLIADELGLSLASEPSGGDPAINALNLLGIGLTSYQEIFSLTDPEAQEPAVGPDGFDPNNWPADQELTADFLCQLKLAAWAAAYVGNVPGFEPPVPSNEDGTFTPAEEEMARGAASAFVALIIGLAQRDAVCNNPPPAAEAITPAEECFDWIWHIEWVEYCYYSHSLHRLVCRYIPKKVWEYVPVDCGSGEPVNPPEVGFPNNDAT